MRARLMILLALAVVTAAPGFATMPAVTPKALIGTWHHDATARTPNGPEKPMTQADISWTFKSGGSGTYHQKVKFIHMDASHPFHWTLKGNSIVLSNKGGPTTTYTVVKVSGDKMVWKNQTLGDYYIVRRK